jgi:Spore Coat Protein U domain
MRKLPLLIAAAMALPGAAQAQELNRGSQRLEMAAIAPVACVISQPTVANQSNASFTATGTSSGQVNITQLVDSASAAPRASSIELSLPVVCNASHRIIVRSANGGLLRTGASGRGNGGAFAEYLSYQVGVDWSGQSVQLDTKNNNANIYASQPGKGALTIRIATPAGGTPLVAGQYSDSIVLEVQPAN